MKTKSEVIEASELLKNSMEPLVIKKVEDGQNAG